MRRALWVWVVTGVVLASEASAVGAGEFHYVLVFGSESHPKLLRYTQTWATFVRVVGEGPDPAGYSLQFHTISWLPRSLEVKVWRPWPEPGVNLDLYQTLEAMLANREGIRMWGPFLLRKEVYDKSLRVREILDSGAAQ